MMPKLRLVSIISLFLLLLATVGPAQAQGVVITVINAKIETITPLINSYQADYIRNPRANEEFYQMLWSHTILPADGSTRQADNLFSRPTDRPDDGRALWDRINATDFTEYRIRIDTYDGPRGRGYVVTYQVEISREVWERSINVGLETQREKGWHLVERGDQ